MSKKSVEVTHDFLCGLLWHTMPKDQGQIITRSFAVDESGMWESHHEKGYLRKAYLHKWKERFSESERVFEPWNGILPTSVCLPKKVKVIK